MCPFQYHKTGVSPLLQEISINPLFNRTHEEAKVTLLWDIISSLSVKQCNSIVDPPSRRFVFETLSETMKATKRILAARLSSKDFGFFGFSAVDFFENFQRRHLDVIWTNWADPADVIVAVVGSMFELLLDVYYMLLPTLLAADRNAGGFIEELADHLLLIENHRKVLMLMLVPSCRSANFC